MRRLSLLTTLLAGALLAGCMGEAHPYAALIEALHSGQPPLESLAMETLLETGDPPPIADVQPLADTGDPRVRVTAVVLLGAAKRPEFVPLFRRKLLDGDATVRLAAAFGLAMTGDGEQATALRDGLGSPDVTVRRTAAWLLGLMGNPSAVGLLKLKLDDPDALVVLRVAEALGRLGSKDGLPQVRALTEHERHPVRCYAARLLGRLGTTADVPRLDAMCQSRYLDVKFAAIAAASRQGDLVRMSLLLDMVDAPEAENRVLAARELGETAYTPALGRLETLLARGDPMERTVAATSILRIRASRESWRSRILSDTTAAPAPTATASPAPLPRP